MAALADNYQYTMFPPLPHDAFIGRRPPLRVSGILFKLGNRHLTVAARGGVIVRANQPHQTIQGEDLIEYLDFEASLRRFKLRNPTLSLVQEAYGGLVSKIQAKVHPKISGVGPGTARYRRLRQPPVGAINPDFHCFSNAIWQVMYRTTFPEALEKALPADVALAPAGSLELAREVLAFFDKLGSSSRPVLHQSLYDSYFGEFQGCVGVGLCVPRLRAGMCNIASGLCSRKLRDRTRRTFLSEWETQSIPRRPTPSLTPARSSLLLCTGPASCVLARHHDPSTTFTASEGVFKVASGTASKGCCAVEADSAIRAFGGALCLQRDRAWYTA